MSVVYVDRGEIAKRDAALGEMRERAIRVLGEKLGFVPTLRPVSLDCGCDERCVVQHDRMDLRGVGYVRFYLGDDKRATIEMFD